MKILPVTANNNQYNRINRTKQPSLKGYRKIITAAPELALCSTAIAMGVIKKMAYDPTLAISSGYGDEFHNSNVWEPGEFEHLQNLKREARERAYIQSHPGIGSGDEYFISDPNFVIHDPEYFDAEFHDFYDE